MMMRDVKEYIKPYVALDDPIPYHSLYIYPIKVKDYFKFIDNIDILTIEKNRIPDIHIISMNYLQFIVEVAFRSPNIVMGDITEGILNITKFYTILSLVFQVDISEIKIDMDKDNKYCVNINNIILSYNDFNELIKIIMFQNFYDYDDREMSEDFRQVVEDYYSLKNKNMRPLTLEDKITAVMMTSGYNEESIKQLTYRRLCLMFEMSVGQIDYIVGLYGYNRKNPPEHWVYKEDKDKYASMFLDADAFADKIKSANG